MRILCHLGHGNNSVPSSPGTPIIYTLFSSYTRLKNIPLCSFAREPNNVKPRDVCATFFKLLRLVFLSPFGAACTTRVHFVRYSLDFFFFFYLSWDLTGKTKELRGIRQFFRLREILLVFSCLEAYFEIFLSPIMYRSSFDYSNVCCLKLLQLYGFVFAS